MKKRLWLMGAVLLALLIFRQPAQADVDYKISRYDADVTLNKDNTATFRQKITYQFGSDYHGQYVTLGTAGEMPAGFDLEPKSKGVVNSGQADPAYLTSGLARLSALDDYDVTVTTNGTPATVIRQELRSLGDGYSLKIYNSGKAGDEVTVQVTWQLQNLLTLYEDIAVLNWKPISDWDVPLHNVTFTLKAPKSQRQKTYVHLGYFQPAAKISRSGDTTRIKVDYVGKKKPLELHAYWDKAAFTAPVTTQTTYLPTFQQKEASIARKTQFYQRQFYQVVPLMSLVALGVTGLAWLIYRKKVSLKRTGLQWLYQAPADLAPQVLAASVFGTDWLELNPTGHGWGKVTFENLVQATLLDLIDRGNLKIEKGESDYFQPLELVHLDGLSDAEKQFIKMAFGEEEWLVYLSDLFRQYKIDKSISIDNGYTASGVRRYGDRKVRELNRDLGSLKRLVDLEIENSGLSDFYRPLTRLEKLLQYVSLTLSFLAGLVSLGCLAFLLASGSLTMANVNLVCGYLVLAVLAWGITAVIYWKGRFERRDGLPRKEYQATYQDWQAFRQMLKDIKTFKRAELESIVVWNRILVYATLFGYADRVQDVIKLYSLKVPAIVDSYMSWGMYDALYHASNRFNNYAHEATTTQNFHVSSGSSGGGGFGGGGFSGGGGGGGGGAF